ALDEVEHARLAYRFASAFAGRSLGPGPLDSSGVRTSGDVRSFVRSLVFEGCVGETLGVADALAQADLAIDDTCARAFARIAEAERRHRGLAWRTLAGLLRTADADLVAFASSCFCEAMPTASTDPSSHGLSAPEHGLLASTVLGAIRRTVLSEVVAPC